MSLLSLEYILVQACRPWGYRGCHAIAPLDLGRSVNPISTREGRLFPHINSSPPDSQTFLRPCSRLSIACVSKFEAMCSIVIPCLYVKDLEKLFFFSPLKKKSTSFKYHRRRSIILCSHFRST